jgi:hypothetical protein
VADERAAAVIRHDAAGEVVGRWSLEEIQAVAAGPFGRAFAAAGEQIYLLQADLAPRPVARQGDFGPVSALTVDGMGRLWVLDRRGERIGKIEPGAAAPAPFGELERRKLTSLVWDGRRLLASSPRDKAVVAIGDDGKVGVLAAQGIQKPLSLAANLAGQLAVLDGRSDGVILFDADGTAVGTLAPASAGAERTTAVALALDGSLLLFDSANQRCVRVP